MAEGSEWSQQGSQRGEWGSFGAPPFSQWSAAQCLASSASPGKFWHFGENSKWVWWSLPSWAQLGLVEVCSLSSSGTCQPGKFNWIIRVKNWFRCFQLTLGMFWQLWHGRGDMNIWRSFKSCADKVQIWVVSYFLVTCWRLLPCHERDDRESAPPDLLPRCRRDTGFVSSLYHCMYHCILQLHSYHNIIIS